MSKTIVIYYSRKGSNKYLAERIAKSLSSDIENIRPRLNVFMLFLMNIGLGIKPLKRNLKDYDKVILCGPIWMGKFVYPLQNFVKKYINNITHLYFITCCGSDYAMKDDKFGHGLVFKIVQNILGEKCVLCEALPIQLVLPDGNKKDTDAFMKAHLCDENFKGEIQERFDSFIQKVTKIEIV